MVNFVNQSNIIAAYLFVAFVIFITMRGELGVYLGFFIGGGAAPVAPGSPSNTATTAGTNTAGFNPQSNGAADGLSTAIKLLPILGL